MTELKKYTHNNTEVQLTDFFGEEHLGRIIFKQEENDLNGKYFFKRNDGAVIRIYHKGFSRVFEKERYQLKLVLRTGGMKVTPQEFLYFYFPDEPEFLETIKFENMRLKHLEGVLD